MEQKDLKGRKLTKKGYVRMTYNGRPRMEHDVVWEKQLYRKLNARYSYRA